MPYFFKLIFFILTCIFLYISGDYDNLDVSDDSTVSAEEVNTQIRKKTSDSCKKEEQCTDNITPTGVGATDVRDNLNKTFKRTYGHEPGQQLLFSAQLSRTRSSR